MNILEKGDYKKIDEDFLLESLDALQGLEKVQKKFNRMDSDTFLNEIRDSIVAKYLGFTHINTQKHGLDAKRLVNNIYEYLEVKNASFTSKSWSATFNDTTLDKSCAFKRGNVFLALGVWKGISDLLFIVYGNNEAMGNYLENRVRNFLYQESIKKSLRSTQTIGFNALVNEYNFTIYSVSKTIDELYNLLSLKNKKIKKESIKSISSL